MAKASKTKAKADAPAEETPPQVADLSADLTAQALDAQSNTTVSCFIPAGKCKTEDEAFEFVRRHHLYVKRDTLQLNKA